MRLVRLYSPVLALAALLVAAFSLSAVAHKGATGIVKIRMDTMRLLKNEVKLIDDMLSGKKYFSQKRLTMTLSKIARHTGTSMIKLFPKGSHQKPSEADPAIWSNWGEFETLAARLEMTANGFLASVKANSAKPELSQEYLKLRAACKSCHKRFQL